MVANRSRLKLLLRYIAIRTRAIDPRFFLGESAAAIAAHRHACGHLDAVSSDRQVEHRISSPTRPLSMLTSVSMLPRIILLLLALVQLVRSSPTPFLARPHQKRPPGTFQPSPWTQSALEDGMLAAMITVWISTALVITSGYVKSGSLANRYNLG